MTESQLFIIAATGLLSGAESLIAPELRYAFLQDTLAMARSLPPNSRISVAVAINSADLPEITLADTPTFTLAGDSAKKRLNQMFEYGFARNADSVCIVGPGTPHLPAAYVLEAFGRLIRHRELIVIGPADGSGIYLVGASSRTPASLWEEISFPAPNVLTEALERTLAHELSVSLLPSIQLIDTPEGLKRLSRDLRRGVATAPHSQSLLRNTGLE